MANEVKDKKKAGFGAKVGKFFAGIGKWFKNIFAELKKVTWPTFSNVVKQTLVVLGVTVIFLIVFIAVDLGLGALYNLFVGKL